MTTEYKYPGLNKEKSLSSKLEIKVSCSNIPKFSTSCNPKVFFFVEKKEFNSVDVISSWTQLDSTEVIKNETYPIFSKSFFIDYYFETVSCLLYIYIYIIIILIIKK